MKVLIISSEFPPLPGGIGNHAFNLAKYLSKLDYEVEVITNSRNEKEERAFDQNQPFKIRWVRRSGFTPLTYLMRLAAYRNAARTLGKDDVLVLSGKFSLFSYAWLGSPKSDRVMSVIHGTEIKQDGRAHTLIQKALNKSKWIVSVSKYSRSKLNEWYDVPSNKQYVINNGFDLKLDYNVEREINDPIKLITIGNLTKRKGQHNVIKALDSIRAECGDVEYHLVGIPTEKSNLDAMASDHKVSDHVHIHGMLSDEERNAVLQDSDIFLMLSEEQENGDFEGFGIAILEANSIGVPAIGTRNSGISDAIDDGVSGKLVDPESKEKIVKAVAEIKSNYERYRSNAYKHSRNFTWEKIIQEYNTLINNA